FLSERLVSAIAKARRVIVLSIVGLYEDFHSRVLEAVANLPFDADVRNLPVAVVVGAGPISVERIAVRVGMFHSKHHRKIDLILKTAHSLSPSIADSTCSCPVPALPL